jgi:hypothetical protein
MDSDSDTACAVGCPIRRSRDQRLLASPPGLSQRATSFIASQCQGIHQMPFISRLSTTPNGKYQSRIAAAPSTADAAISLEDTCRAQTGFPLPWPRGSSRRLAGRARLGHVTTRYSPFNQQTATKVQQHRRCEEDFIPSDSGGTSGPPPYHQTGGGERDRTDDLLLAKQALSQLSYTPAPDRRRQRPGQRGPAAPQLPHFCI